jgi:hypothetical protein
MAADKKKKRKSKKNWVFSQGRRESLKKAQRVHSILVNIGKKYRYKEAQKLKIKI